MFPLRPRIEAGKLCASSGGIHDALVLLLGTRPGERQGQPHFGCPLHRLRQLADDSRTRALIAQHIRAAVARCEPRLASLEIQVSGLGAAPLAFIVELKALLDGHPFQSRIVLIDGLRGLEPSLDGAP